MSVSGDLLRGLCRLSGRQTLRDAGRRTVESLSLTIDALRFRLQPGLFLPHGRKASLEKARGLDCLLA